MAAFHPAHGASKGCIVAVHGLNGSMRAQHILWLIRPVLEAGFSLLRVNMRGAGPARRLARGTYNAGAGADLLPFIDAAAARDPGVPLFMMAHSLGGTAALNMALDFPDEAARLRGLVTIGTPLDMAATARRFSRPRNRLYVRYMLAGLKQIAEGAPGLAPRYRPPPRRRATSGNSTTRSPRRWRVIRTAPPITPPPVSTAGCTGCVFRRLFFRDRTTRGCPAGRRWPFPNRRTRGAAPVSW